MSRMIQNLSILLAIIAICGCNSVIHKKFSVDTTPAESLSIDARQRVILVTEKGGKHGDKYHEFHVVCAEPSPDMFSTIASSLGANVSTGDKSLGMNASLVEGAVKMGPRTQTIQLLRDGLYRACEGYMNGILDWREYKAIVLSYDVVMMTALAIDGLSSPQDLTAAIAGGASSSDASSTTTGGDATMHRVQGTVSNENAKEIRGILADYYEYKKYMYVKRQEEKEKDAARKREEANSGSKDNQNPAQ